MMWPEALEQAIETELTGVPPRELASAAASLSARYRTSSACTPSARMSSAERLAYLAVRAPATYAAVRATLRELSVPLAAPEMPAIESLLDLGAGPGMGLWAALDLFDTLRAATLVERDAASVEIGRRLAHAAGFDRRAALAWQRADLRELRDVVPHDLVLLSYALGELDDAAARALVSVAWRAARVALVIVEPGTPRHFARLLAARRQAIDEGARLAAPCPHARACPMTAPDWCHFAVRLPRTRLHRRLKQGALSYEDEKFSYVIATREPASPPAPPASVPARIIRRPELHKGFVRLALCTAHGLEASTVTRSQRERYRAARDVAWGDAWPESTASESR